MLKIIFAVETPFTPRDFERFGITLLQDLGHTVEILDLTILLNPMLEPCELNLPCRILKAKCKSEVTEYLDQLSSRTCIVMLVGLRLRSLWFFRLASKTRAMRCNMILGSLVSPVRKRTFTSILRKIRTGLLNPQFVLDILVRNSWPLLPIKPVHFTMVDGNKSRKETPQDNSTHVLLAHSLDYELFRNSNGHEPQKLVEGRYAVFIDEYVPFHPDYKVMRREAPCSAEEYYPKLQNFFLEIERKFDLKVIVAAHPRSEYEKHEKDYFGNRPRIKGHTPELIRNAALVVLHASTAISFAVLYRKPILFCSMGSFDRLPIFASGITANAKFFLHPVYNLDEQQWPFPDEIKIPMDRYQDYHESFIKAPSSPEKPLWRIFSDHVQSSVKRAMHPENSDVSLEWNT